MKIILNLALSNDGFIATEGGDSSWVSLVTENHFFTRAREAGCMVVGRKSFEQYKDIIYPISGTLNIVLSHNFSDEYDSRVLWAKSLAEVLEIVKHERCPGLLIAGGAAVSNLFLENGLIDEVYFSIHTTINLGHGIKPFGNLNLPEMTILDSVELGDGVIQKHYKVLNPS